MVLANKCGKKLLLFYLGEGLGEVGHEVAGGFNRIEAHELEAAAEVASKHFAVVLNHAVGAHAEMPVLGRVGCRMREGALHELQGCLLLLVHEGQLIVVEVEEVDKDASLQGSHAHHVEAMEPVLHLQEINILPFLAKEAAQLNDAPERDALRERLVDVVDSLTMPH